ncbi:type I-E CRISPR-associated protein Cas5/CasD [Aristophania vespae]|uniref:Type I-E CRISPR-associated protein Cas5/CasD n=1 Tax=Aristophania vespae TaxID=2697033 RepID=A0A6P1N9G1_9PROT|nr:type I-E CRISPR-associated protein Cas5/CasD [Aristophania vespae]QHI95195.1 type I-E CRISPR-associated protein Cas5/CasD [Aristophania vespae]
MGRFLTFAMVAPIASFGSLAVGEERGSWERPARSAVLGLIASCLGLTREEEEAHRKLSDSCGIAILYHSSKTTIRDFHTAQMAQTQRNEYYATRADEIMRGKLSTVVSKRDYRTGIWHIGALWLRDHADGWSLEQLQQAMNKPVFTPYLGRKSCPLALPLAPEIIKADTASEALLIRYENGKEVKIALNDEDKSGNLHKNDNKETNEIKKKSRNNLINSFFYTSWNRDNIKTKTFREYFTGKDDNDDVRIAMDAQDVPDHQGAFEVTHYINRHDQPISRVKWEFGLRSEALLTLKKEKQA